jgi:hypothetical protein
MCADDMSVLDALHGRDGCFDDRSLYLVMNTDHKTRTMICRIDDLKALESASHSGWGYRAQCEGRGLMQVLLLVRGEKARFSAGCMQESPVSDVNCFRAPGPRENGRECASRASWPNGLIDLMAHLVGAWTWSRGDFYERLRLPPHPPKETSDVHGCWWRRTYRADLAFCDRTRRPLSVCCCSCCLSVDA